MISKDLALICRIDIKLLQLGRVGRLIQVNVIGKVMGKFLNHISLAKLPRLLTGQFKKITEFFSGHFHKEKIKGIGSKLERWSAGIFSSIFPSMRFGFCLSIFFLFLCSWGISQNSPWWKGTVVYQIYPRSFMDTNGDGIGDLQGVISKLDYLADLGIETIWLSPFFQSPQQDFGYDISNYRKVDPLFGDEKVLQSLIEEVHHRNMKIVFDLVMNHTSVEHPWFQESAANPTNPKADWYVWQDGRGKGSRPPNNWRSTIGGSGWHFHERRGQWYFSSFLPFQPDLNYHHPEVKQAMLDMAKYWLDHGVDGFRLDIFNVIYHDSTFGRNPLSFRPIPDAEHPDGFFQHMSHTVNLPENYVFARELRDVLDSAPGPDRFMVGEVFGDHPTIRGYLGEQADGLHLAFLFDMLDFDFRADFFADKIRTYEYFYPDPYSPTLVFSNHDRKRSMSRLGGEHEKAHLLACFQLTARGVPFIYQGEEIGMEQLNLPAKAALDPLARQYDWIPQFFLDRFPEAINRDGCRTPMQWNSSPNAGFSPPGITTWLPVNSNHTSINVAQQQKSSGSLWHTYKDLLELRRSYPALAFGEIELITIPGKPNLLSYTRSFQGEEITVVLNFSQKEVEIGELGQGKQLLQKSNAHSPNDEFLLQGFGYAIYLHPHQ